MKPFFSGTLVFRISLAATATGILILATTPLSYPVVSGFNDKFNHIFAFFVLSLLTDFSFPEKKFTPVMVLTLFGYGMAIEIIQHFLPFRMFSLWDAGADGAGISLYMITRGVLEEKMDKLFDKKQSKTDGRP